MDLPNFYEPFFNQPQHILSEASSKHCSQVLRMKAGEHLQLTDGKGNVGKAIIVHAHTKNTEVKIEEIVNYKLQDPRFSIAISLIKNSSRLEWFLEKATETGVYVIQPLICAHTEKENFRYERMNGILIAAMLQSKQAWLPQLHHPKKFEEFVSEAFDGIKLIAHCREGSRFIINALNVENKNTLIAIGPEGDFSQLEIDTALQKGFIPASLGNTRLRTETAGIVAAALLNNLYLK